MPGPRTALLISMLSSLPLAAQQTDGRRPNVVLVVVDDLGWTDLGCYGSDLYATPHVDALAAAGVRFTAAYAACTVCSPTRAALLTGQYPARTRVTDYINGAWANRKPAWRARQRLAPPAWTEHLEHDHVTLAEALRARGYATAHVGKWHLTPRSPDPAVVEPYYPQHHGFDVNVAGNQWGMPGSHFWPYRAKGRDGLAARVASFPPAADGKDGDYLADLLTAHAVEWIEARVRAADGPFFLHLSHYGVHTPIQAPPADVATYRERLGGGDSDDPGGRERRHRNAKYAAMVESIDRSVGALRAALDELGVADETLIVFTSDNGGLDRNGNPTDNAPLRAGKGSPYEGGVRVPTIVTWPGVTTPGSVAAEPVITVDLFSTVLEAAGPLPAAAPAGADPDPDVLDGVSLVPLLRDPGAHLARDAIFWHYPHYHGGGSTPYSAVRAGRWRLVEFFVDDRVELYDLAADPSEANDLAAREPERVATLRARLAAWRTHVGAQLPVPNPTYRER